MKSLHVESCLVAASLVALSACSAGDAHDTSGGGAASTTGGANAGTGASATIGGSGAGTGVGGEAPAGGSAAGGAVTTGGMGAPGGLSATGGALATGGLTLTGGTPGAGGLPVTGGTSPTGGISPTGGSLPTGGDPLTGGASPVGGGGTATGGTSTGGADTSGGAGTGGAGTASCSGPGSLSPGNVTMSLTVGGNSYPMIVHVPPTYDGSTPHPLVFDFHGLGGDETQMQFISGWASLGDSEGFITVFPGGVDNAWNAGFCCSDTPTDVDFVREAISTLASEGCVDTKRVYASGCSNGGGMSYRLACEAADVIAAVAPVDFDCAVGFSCSDCSPSRPITEIQFRGTDDSAVPYDGAQPNFEAWGQLNGCTGTPEPLPGNASCQRYPSCAEGVETILCTVQDGSHCGSYSSFSIAETAWGVISNYSLP